MEPVPLDPEHALPWQKLAAAICDLVGAAAQGTDHPGLDEHEARAQAVADLLVGNGTIDPAAMLARMEALAVRLAHDKDKAHPKTRFSNVRPNDIGGLPGGRVDPDGGHVAAWEQLALALGPVLGQHRITNLHERRRSVEDLGDDYHRLGYFERAVQGVANLLYEKGVLTRAEVDRKIAAMRNAR